MKILTLRAEFDDDVPTNDILEVGEHLRTELDEVLQDEYDTECNSSKIHVDTKYDKQSELPLDSK